MKLYPIVLIEWADSKSFGGWRYEDEAEEIILQPARLIVLSVGFLFCETDQHVTLVQNSGYDQVGEGVTIPRVAIRSITTIHRGQAMPLRKGKRAKTKKGFSSNVKTLVDDFKRNGKIGTSKPKSKKAAIKQAVAISFALKRGGKKRSHSRAKGSD